MKKEKKKVKIRKKKGKECNNRGIKKKSENLGKDKKQKKRKRSWKLGKKGKKWRLWGKREESGN